MTQWFPALYECVLAFLIEEDAGLTGVDHHLGRDEGRENPPPRRPEGALSGGWGKPSDGRPEGAGWDGGGKS
jgi:hypothetical protein